MRSTGIEPTQCDVDVGSHGGTDKDSATARMGWHRAMARRG